VVFERRSDVQDDNNGQNARQCPMDSFQGVLQRPGICDLREEGEIGDGNDSEEKGFEAVWENWTTLCCFQVLSGVFDFGGQIRQKVAPARNSQDNLFFFQGMRVPETRARHPLGGRWPRPRRLVSFLSAFPQLHVFHLGPAIPHQRLRTQRLGLFVAILGLVVVRRQAVVNQMLFREDLKRLATL